MPTTETRRLNPLVLWAIFLAIIVLAFVLLRSSTREQVEVRAAAVSHQNLVSSVSTNGKVEPIDEFQAYAPAAGVVAKVYVQVLQKVRTGDLLIKLDDSDAVAKLATATATLRTAEATLHDMEQGGS
jgi:HlyD family secretion protein